MYTDASSFWQLHICIAPKAFGRCKSCCCTLLQLGLHCVALHLEYATKSGVVTVVSHQMSCQVLLPLHDGLHVCHGHLPQHAALQCPATVHTHSHLCDPLYSVMPLSQSCQEGLLQAAWIKEHSLLLLANTAHTDQPFWQGQTHRHHK